jgi:predicted DNA-binding WGR domain protein
VREWGRLGSPGTVRLESYGSEDQAREAQRLTVQTRIRHGYRVNS